MRITGLRIDRFGVWSDLRMEDLDRGITVFFGPNEAGKSTLMQYIRTVLYGFAANRCERFVIPPRQSGTLIHDAGRLGGSLFLSSHDGEYQVRRYANDSNPLSSPGDVEITTNDGDKHAGQRLATLLNGIDESIYNNVFAVGLREMQQLGSLDDTAAARQLYSLSTGTDRVSLVDVTRQLHVTNCRLVGCDDRPSLLAEYVDQQDVVQAQIGQLAVQTDRWARLVAERDGLDEEIRRLEDAQNKSNKRADVAELALRIKPTWDELRRLNVEIEAMGVVAEVPQRIVEQLQSLESELQLHRQRFDELQGRREAVRQNSEELQISDSLDRHSARIMALLDQRVAIQKLDERVDRFKNELDEAEFEIHAEQERLGLTETENGILPRFDPTTIAALQDPAYLLDRDREMLEVTKQEMAGYKSQAEVIQREIATALGHDPDWFDKKDAADVLRAMEKTTSTAAGLRRRVKLQREHEELRETLAELEARRKHVLRNQLLPWDLVRALGALFALGSVLIFCGLFGHALGWPDSRRGTFLVMGAITSGLAALLKFVLDNPSREGLREIDRQHELLKTQVADAERESGELDDQLPGRRTGPINLRDTETRLVRLEALMPLENQRRQIMDLVAQAERRAIEIAKSMKETRRRWEETLRSLGLNTKLTPAQMKALSGQAGGLGQFHRVLEERRAQYEAAHHEQSACGERLRDLLADVLLRPVSERPSDQLNQLAAALAEQEEQLQKRELLKVEDRQLKRDQQNVSRSIRQLERRRNSQIAMAGAADRDDLNSLLNRRKHLVDLTNRRDTLQAEIDKAMRHGELEKSVQRQLQQESAELPDRLQRLQLELQQASARLKELQFRRGELAEKIRNLTADRTLGKSQLNLGLIQYQLDQGIQKWKVVNTISALLANVYKRYEKDRQPETLKEASRYLGQMTSGRYTRIWTPLAEDVLIVEDNESRSLPVEMLSRGTREQLFLSLRLALVSCYARRNVNMPVILDDVLVNFDAERTAAAAAVLTDFARAGYQMLVFTCHQHIREIFENLQVDVREIPRRDEAASPVVAATSTVESEELTTVADMQEMQDFADIGPGSGEPAEDFESAKLVLGYSDHPAWVAQQWLRLGSAGVVDHHPGQVEPEYLELPSISPTPAPLFPGSQTPPLGSQHDRRPWTWAWDRIDNAETPFFFGPIDRPVVRPTDNNYMQPTVDADYVSRHWARPLWSEEASIPTLEAQPKSPARQRPAAKTRKNKRWDGSERPVPQPRQSFPATEAKPSKKRKSTSRRRLASAPPSETQLEPKSIEPTPSIESRPQVDRPAIETQEKKLVDLEQATRLLQPLIPLPLRPETKRGATTPNAVDQGLPAASKAEPVYVQPSLPPRIENATANTDQPADPAEVSEEKHKKMSFGPDEGAKPSGDNDEIIDVDDTIETAVDGFEEVTDSMNPDQELDEQMPVGSTVESSVSGDHTAADGDEYEYEYEYIDVEDAADADEVAQPDNTDDEEDEYEYVEVDVDEDGDEIIAESEDDDYEYVVVDDDEDGETDESDDYEYLEVEEEELDEDGDADEDEEYEYEYIEVDEDAEGETDDDEEYEYLDDDDEDEVGLDQRKPGADAA